MYQKKKKALQIDLYRFKIRSFVLPYLSQLRTFGSVYSRILSISLGIILFLFVTKKLNWKNVTVSSKALSNVAVHFVVLWKRKKNTHKGKRKMLEEYASYYKKKLQMCDGLRMKSAIVKREKK